MPIVNWSYSQGGGKQPQICWGTYPGMAQYIPHVWDSQYYVSIQWLHRNTACATTEPKEMSSWCICLAGKMCRFWQCPRELFYYYVLDSELTVLVNIATDNNSRYSNCDYYRSLEARKLQ